MSPDFPGYVCEIDFDNSGNFLPFGATPDDPEPHGREIFARIQAGEFGPIAPYEPDPGPSPEELLRSEEQRLLQYLSDTDWHVIRSQETGLLIPQNILNKREEARYRISAIRLELYNISFS